LGLRRNGPEYKGPCPLCGGTDRCHAKQGHSQILLYCRNGCAFPDLARAAGSIGPTERVFIPSRIPAERTPPISETRPKAIEFWSNADDDDATVASHPYAKLKGITHAFGARRGVAGGARVGYNVDCILVPNRNWDGEFIGVEIINASKDKQTYGNKGLLILGNPEDAPLIHICEGWATAWALSQMFTNRFAAIVCFGKQIQSAAREVSKRYTGRPIVHAESAQNRDAWDIWCSGRGDAYAKRVMEVLA